MAVIALNRFEKVRKKIWPILIGPPTLAFLPALTLGAFWLGGDAALLIMALGTPLLFAICGAFGLLPKDRMAELDSVTGLLLRDGFYRQLEQIYEDTAISGLRSVCIVLEIDDFKELCKRHGEAAGDLIAQRTGDRILETLRDSDTVARMGDGRFAVCLSPVRQLDLELCIQMAGRLQSSIEAPISLDGISLYVSCSIGFCPRSRAPGKSADEWMDAAVAALTEAQSTGPSAIRAFSIEMHRQTKMRNDLREEAAQALENGQIQPWFQPQISTDTGKITGFEALARWAHPMRGLIPPNVFLPALEEAGLLERLSEVMLYHALTAVKAWDASGVDIPRIGVNFSGDELHNPNLVEKIRWEMDRFDLAPDRLSIEVLESVVCEGPNDMITRNIRGLGQLGCRIDLDDFGTGNASIAAIRRFDISRIKIDRSFVMKADRDPEQQRLIGAI